MQTESETLQVCSSCGTWQVPEYKFCNKCGQQNPGSAKLEAKKDKEYRENLKYLSIYSIFTIVLLLVAALTEDTLEVLVIWTISFALIDLIFAFLQPSVWALLDPQRIKVKPLILIFGIGIISGVVVSFSIDNLNFLLYEETYSTMPLFIGTEYPLALSIIILAVCPALFEELAFRGFVFNNLEKIAGTKSAIWGSSFLFGLVHFSLLSLIWIIPFGLFLAYYRNRYSTLIYGILGHFTHNATTILLEHYGVL